MYLEKIKQGKNTYLRLVECYRDPDTHKNRKRIIKNYCRRRLSLSVILMPILSVLHRCFHPIMQSIADANFIHRSCYGLVSKNIKKP